METGHSGGSRLLRGLLPGLPTRRVGGQEGGAITQTQRQRGDGARSPAQAVADALDEATVSLLRATSSGVALVLADYAERAGESPYSHGVDGIDPRSELVACHFCGRRFWTANHTVARWCSQSCRQRAYQRLKWTTHPS